MGRRLGYRAGQLPVTEDVAGRILRLPLYYDITQEQQNYVIDCIERFFAVHPVDQRRPDGSVVTTNAE